MKEKSPEVLCVVCINSAGFQTKVTDILIPEDTRDIAYIHVPNIEFHSVYPTIIKEND